MIRAAILLGLASPAAAEIAISVGDGKQVLVNGVQTVPDDPQPDMLSLIELGPESRIVAEIPLPTSVIGPPVNVAITPDARLALVSSARRIDPADRHALIPDDRISVVDLNGRPPRVIATLRAGAGASGIAINPAGTLALVANRSAGSLSLFTIDGDHVEAAGTLTIGDAKSAPATPIFFDGGRRALVSRDGDHRLSTIRIEGTKMTLQSDSAAGGLRPYDLDTAGDRAFAIVGNIGGGARDVDTISLIDLRGENPRVVDTVAVGLTPEGVAMAPDGHHVAVSVANGSDKAPGSQGYHPWGLLQIWRIEDGHLTKVTEAKAGRWVQGVAWTRNSKDLLIQSDADGRIDLFHFDGHALIATGSLRPAAPPAGLRVN